MSRAVDMRSKYMAFAVLALAALELTGPTIAASALTDWSVVATFRSSGSPICAVKFPVPRGSQTLTLEARAPKNSSQLGAQFTVGGLPPLLAGKKGVVRDIKLSIGTWSATDLKADWAKGSGDSNSRLVLQAAPDIGTVIQPIASGGRLEISVPLASGNQSYEFDVTGGHSPMVALVDCVRRWTSP